MAERLTMREVIEHWERDVIQAEMQRLTDTKQYMEHKQVREWLEELQHYEDLEEQNRLITLPCKIGDTVYGRFQCYDGKEIRECKVIGIRACQFKADSKCYYFVDVEFNIIDPFYMDRRLMTCRHQAVIGNDYGSWERVFFTCEEVETALKGAEE